jgi:hypothetical protein
MNTKILTTEIATAARNESRLKIDRPACSLLGLSDSGR